MRQEISGPMKAIIEYNLPEDQNEFNLANRAKDLFCFAWEVFKVRHSLDHHNISETEFVKQICNLVEKYAAVVNDID